MQTFSQLLTAYMLRTGVSDSELARTLGISRQTIFRWKEGQTARPRSRDDVLRCAAKLRLNPDERDGLLLAAGFQPDTMPAVVADVSPSPTPSPVVVTTSAEAATSPALPLAPLALPQRHPSGRRWLLWANVFGGVVFVAVLAIILWQRNTIGYPIAAPGETLFVISNIGSPAARLQAALEREVQTLRRERTRVVVWPDEITDGNAARQALQVSGATAALFGRAEGERITAGAFVAGDNATAYERGLGALVSVPPNRGITVNAGASADIQALALFMVAQWYLAHQDYAFARAALIQALAAPPSESDARTALLFYSGYAAQVAGPLDPAATEFYSQAVILKPDLLEAYLNRGLAAVRSNLGQAWQSDFTRALALQNDRTDVRLALCWAYALDNQSRTALPHCDAAVAHDLTGRSREARAIALAEAGRLADAATDLSSFLDWLAKQPERLRLRYGTTRADWLRALQTNQNPFDAPTLDRLRVE